MTKKTPEQLQTELNNVHALYRSMISNFKIQIADMSERHAIEMANKDQNIQNLTLKLQEMEQSLTKEKAGETK